MAESEEMLPDVSIVNLSTDQSTIPTHCNLFQRDEETVIRKKVSVLLSSPWHGTAPNPSLPRPFQTKPIKSPQEPARSLLHGSEVNGDALSLPASIQVSGDSPYAFLTQFDVIFLIDDSGNMASQSWRETQQAFGAINPVSTAKAPFSRRGRGQRKNNAYWRTVGEHDGPQNPFERDCLFAAGNGRLTTPATSYMDSTSAVPRCMSMKYLHELKLETHMSTDFDDPGLICTGKGGQTAKMTGIVRDISFRLKGSSMTFKGDFYVSEFLDGFYDILFGWQFMCNEAADILEKAHRVYQDAKAFISNAASDMKKKIGSVVSQTQRRVSDFVAGVCLPPPPYSLVNILEGDYLVTPRVL